MASSLNIIKNWFRTGLKPTQAQFWATWDSFWHKEEFIPQQRIEGLEQDLNAKANTNALHPVAFSGSYNDLEDIPDQEAREELIKATVVEPNFTNQYTFNINVGRIFILPLTEDLILNPPALETSKGVSYTADVTGDFNLDLSAFTIIPSDDYDGLVINRLIFESFKKSNGTQVNRVTIENIPQ